MSVPRARVLNLMKAQSQIFSTAYNPDGTRMGTKVLRQRLRGPALASYYPRKVYSITTFRKAFGEEITTWDEAEIDRLDHVEELKLRGKNAPKKKSGPPEKKKK